MCFSSCSFGSRCHRDEGFGAGIRRYALRDDQWERLAALHLPGSATYRGRTATDTRLFVDAVLFRFRAGIAWRDLPERFGNWHRVYVRFSRWSAGGVWQRIFAELSKDKNNEYAMIDSTVVRAHRNAAGVVRRKKGRWTQSYPGRRSRRQKAQSAKRSHRQNSGRFDDEDSRALRCGRSPHRFVLDGGQAHDLQGFDVLSGQITASVLIADKGYDADARVRAVLAGKTITAVIPGRKKRKTPIEYDKEAYKRRQKIENWFSRLKDFRAVATRYDKRARNFLSGVYLAAAMTWMN